MIPYNSIKELITIYIYGGSIEPNSIPALVTELISTGACIFLVALPFVIVFKVIKMLIG